jgi:hypothetical protein
MKGAVYSSRSALYAGLFANGVRRAEKGAECETVMVLLTSMSVTVFLQLGGLALWTDVSDHHGVLLTSAGGGCVFGQP